MNNLSDPVSNTLIDYIRRSVIGADETVSGPFGSKPVVYADYTASGRALSFIEDYLRSEVLPLYANTHTESSGTGLQTSRFRQEAREIIANCVGAGPEHAVIFTGSGSTAAIDKLIAVLGLRIPSRLEDEYALSEHIAERPVVFIGPYEHHSNELPWRESIADVVTIGEDKDGHIDLVHLEQELRAHQDRPQLIGSFSAASNVTGIITDARAVSALLHRYGALALWDFAAAAPYVSIDMGSRGAESGDGAGSGDEKAGSEDAYFDAVFVSPHKFIGGPGTPGLLVARRELFTNRIPAVPGGGTVAYVNSTTHDYLTDPEHREEGGTPDIIGSIRAGLVFQLQAAVGIAEIQRREARLLERAIASWSAEPNIELLGDLDVERLSVLSFMVRAGESATEAVSYLHHNFVVAVLNDLFGIQARGGCSCAGPYGHRLLGIDLDRSQEFEREINRGCEGIKPGWVRVNLNYFLDDEQVDYVIAAIRLIARSAHVLLPLYRFEPDSGLWRHRDGGDRRPLSLRDISYVDGSMGYVAHATGPKRSLRDQLAEAEQLLTRLAAEPPQPLPRATTNPDFEHLRWFPYSVDA